MGAARVRGAIASASASTGCAEAKYEQIARGAALRATADLRYVYMYF